MHENGKNASCEYSHSRESYQFICKLNGGGSFEFSDYTMNIGNDEYLLQSSNTTDYNQTICEDDDNQTNRKVEDTDNSTQISSPSMIYSSLLILILLNILLF